MAINCLHFSCDLRPEDVWRKIITSKAKAMEMVTRLRAAPIRNEVGQYLIST